MKNVLAIAVLCCSLISCEESNNPKSKRKHHGGVEAEQVKLDPVKQSLTFNWEKLLGSGEMMMGVTPLHFMEFRHAVKGGAFDPNTVLSKDEIARIGPSCTNAQKDEQIGLRRFERTLTEVPELMTMKDGNGQQLKDWLVAMNRKDLLSVVEQRKAAAKP